MLSLCVIENRFGSRLAVQTYDKYESLQSFILEDSFLNSQMYPSFFTERGQANS